MAYPDAGPSAPTPVPKPVSPTAPSYNRGAFARAVLRRLNIPINGNTVRIMLSWMGGENTRARFNPLATTQQASGATNFNKVGVKNYKTFAQGVDATVQTITNGRYASIIAGLKSGDAARTFQAIGASPWGTKTFPQVVDYKAAASTPLGAGSSAGYGGSTTTAYSAGLSPQQYGKVAGVSFNLPFNVQKYVDQAIKEVGADSPIFNEYLRSKVIHSPEFRKFYPGIFRANGTLIVSPEQYEQTAEEYRSLAAERGFSLSRATSGRLINMEVSPQEFNTRAEALQVLRTNPQVRAFLAQNTNLKSAKQQMAFVLGQADQKVYDTYEAALLRAQLGAEGVQLSQHEALYLARTTQGVLSIEEAKKKAAALGEDIETASPELGLYGINQQELIRGEFGASSSTAQEQRRKQAIRQARAARASSRVSPRTGVNEEGKILVSTVLEQPGL